MNTTHTQIIFFSKILKTQTKRRFLALIKHYIINLKFWNSPFCWAKFLTRAPTSHNSVHLTFVYVSAIFNFVFAIMSRSYKLLQHISFILFSIFIHKDESLNNIQTTVYLKSLK